MMKTLLATEVKEGLMAHTHPDVHTHRDEAAASTGIATGFMVALAAFVIAAVIAGIVLLIAQPWDDDGAVIDTPAVPGIEEPASGDADGGAAEDAGQ